MSGRRQITDTAICGALSLPKLKIIKITEKDTKSNAKSKGDQIGRLHVSLKGAIIFTEL